jgi:hypothetical protein
MNVMVSNGIKINASQVIYQILNFITCASVEKMTHNARAPLPSPRPLSMLNLAPPCALRSVHCYMLQRTHQIVVIGELQPYTGIALQGLLRKSAACKKKSPASKPSRLGSTQ